MCVRKIGREGGWGRVIKCDDIVYLAACFKLMLCAEIGTERGVYTCMYMHRSQEKERYQ